MIKEFLSTKESEIVSNKISELLNSQNKLQVHISPKEVLSNLSEYVTISDDDDELKVIACARVKRMSYYLAEIKHVSVDPNYQGKGLGKRILSIAEYSAYSLPGIEMLQSTIRDSNVASKSIFKSRSWKEINSFVRGSDKVKIIVVIK